LFQQVQTKKVTDAEKEKLVRQLRLLRNRWEQWPILAPSILVKEEAKKILVKQGNGQGRVVDVRRVCLKGEN